MEKFRKEMMSIELYFAHVSEKYFYDNLREYYDFLTLKLSKTKAPGTYGKEFYKLKNLSSIRDLELDFELYKTLPCFVCVSKKFSD